MKNKNVLKRIIEHIGEHKKILEERYKVKNIYIFGSIARGDFSSKSDIDVLVDFSSSDIGLFQFVELKEYLEFIVGRKIDLVTREALSDWMKEEVEKDSIRVA